MRKFLKLQFFFLMKKKLHIGQRGQQKCGNGATYLKKFLVVDKNLAKPTISWFFSKVLTFWGVFGSRKNCL